MTILCTIDLETREVSIPSGQCIAAYDHNVDVIRFQAETIPGFSLDTSSIRIAAQGPNKARHDYAVDPSTVQIEEETGYITFDWPIPAGVTEMPIGAGFKYGDRGQLIFAVCAEIIDGSTVSKAWHSDDGIITVVAHLEPESGGGEDPEEEATNAQKIAQLQTDVAVINTQVGALANGSPTPVATVAEMTDESAVYLYTGSETGYTAGNWYYYNGTAWTSGGVYGGAVTSTTFNQHGVPADDFATGQALADKANSADVTALDDRVTAVEGDVSDLKDDLDYYRNEFGASVQYANATAFENGYRYNLSSSNVFSKVSADGYATLAIMNLPAGTYYFNYTYDAFCIIEKISDGTYEKLQARTGYSNTAITGGRNITIDYDFNVYLTRQTAWTSETLWCNDALPSTYVHGIYGLPFLSYAMQTESIAVTSSNYASVLPDLDDAEKNRVYVMVFANGSTNIPANYPFASWKGTTATLITFGTANSSAITQMLFLDGYIFTRRKNSATTWNGWYTPTSKVFTVDINGGGDYTSLKDCCADAINYANAKIYVNSGTYNLIEEFGSDYFANLGSSDDRAGIQLGNGMHLIFSSQAKVVCHYTGDNTNVDRYFSPFNSKNGSFILENATIEASRVRYCVHDEHTTNTNRYTSVYKNCHMTIDNTASAVWTNAQCIGGGLGTNGEIIIEDSYFYGEGSTQNQGVVSYHNCSSAGSKSRIVVKGCYFDGSNANVRFGYYGTSTEVTECFVHGNSFSVAPLVRAENASASVVNMKMYDYNNEIRSEQ